MKSRNRQVLIIRFASTECGAVVSRLLATSHVAMQSPFWRQLAPNLLTIRAAARTPDLAEKLAAHEGVERVIALGDSRLYSHWPNGDPNPICLSNGVVFDGTAPIVIAGPCSVEGPDQVLEIAQAVAQAGAGTLRGGVFKPRTSPYDFGGLGADGLNMMVRAGQKTGLPICTEVLDPSCLDTVAAQSDILQIGSRNMHNTPFLFALGADPRGRPALLKRGFGATVEELLEAAEYFLLGRIAAGHPDPGLILCERGVRTFETSTRFTLDIGAITVLRGRTHLPILVDPSHPAGDRKLVPSLAAAGMAAGADGLIVEVHHDPSCAWCDGPQSLTFEGFRELMAAVNSFGRGSIGEVKPAPATSW